MKTTASMMILVLAAALGACLETDDSDGPQVGWQDQNLIGDFDNATVNGNLAVLDASLVGDMATVTELRHYATEVWADSYAPGSASIRVTVDTGEGAAMGIINIYSQSGTFTDLSQALETGQANLDVVGCSGPEVGYWEFDAAGDDVEVEVEPDPQNPDVLAIQWRATFTQYDYENARYDESGYYEPAVLTTTTTSGRLVIDTSQILDVTPADYGDEQVTAPVQGPAS